MGLRRLGRPCAVAAVLLGAATAGCNQSDPSGERPPGSGEGRIGAPVRAADCSDWRRASVRERYGTVRDLREFAGGPVGGSARGRGATLDDDKGYELLENYCKEELASSFKLYKLYTRAASFGAR